MTDDNVTPGATPGGDPEVTPEEAVADATASPEARSAEAGSEGGPDGVHSFGDAAAEMANETELESPVEGAVAGDAISDELTLAQKQVSELTGDLQRLQAEYLNYKRRVDRDRELIRENATYAVLSPIVEVLDTIDRAREHGELEGGFKAVADQLERIVSNLGLSRVGEVGDAFDPTVHEALSHIGTDPEVEVTTCKVIAKAGYRIGDRVVRAAQVLVVDPED